MLLTYSKIPFLLYSSINFDKCIQSYKYPEINMFEQFDHSQNSLCLFVANISLHSQLLDTTDL